MAGCENREPRMRYACSVKLSDNGVRRKMCPEYGYAECCETCPEWPRGLCGRPCPKAAVPKRWGDDLELVDFRDLAGQPEREFTSGFDKDD